VSPIGRAMTEGCLAVSHSLWPAAIFMRTANPQ
jgi:hypothetical protein